MARQLASLREARLELLPTIENLIAEDDIAAAFTLAREAANILPDDPALARLWKTGPARAQNRACHLDGGRRR